MPDPSKKMIILCEGQHDCLLLQEILDDFSLKYATKEEIAKPKQNGEWNIILDFYRDSKLKFLIKDENGKNRCIDNFCELYDMDKGRKMAVILDSDGGSTLKLFRKRAKDILGKDILLMQTESFYTTKDRMKHKVIFISGSLEDKVRSLTGRDLDVGDRTKQLEDIRYFKNCESELCEKLRSLLLS
jgi:hypothetical protein